MSTGITRDAQFLREVVVGSSHGIFSVDSSGTVVFSNGVLEDSLGIEPDRIRGERVGDLCVEGDDPMERIRETTADPHGSPIEFTLLDADGNRVPVVATCEAIDFDGSTYVTLWCQEQVIEGEAEPAFPGAESRAEESSRAGGTIREVTGIGRDLLDAEDPQAVAETGLEATQRILGTDVVCVRLFDEGANALQRVATTDAAAELLDSQPAFDLNASLAGRAFRRGEPVFDRPEPGAPGDAVGRANLHVPLGERGTLTAFESGRTFTTADAETAENLASMLAAALAGIDAEDAGDGAFDLPVREIIGDAVEGETREAIGRQICERLVATGEFGGAWFVSTDAGGEWRALEASAGDTDSPPEGVRRAGTGAGDAGPVSRAADAGDVCTVRRQETVTNGNAAGNGGGPDDETVETTVAVPVAHGDRTYGVVVARTHSEGALDAGRRSELEVLGDVAGLAAYAAESKKLLLSEKIQQLEFEVTDRDCLAVGVSEETGAFCEVEHQTLTNDGNHLCYLQVEGTSPASAREATAELGSVTDCRVVETGDDGCLLEVIKTYSGAEAMMDVGATVRRATADDGVGTLIVDAHISADVREVVDAYTSLNPDSQLVAKRELDRPVPTTDALRESVEDVLTERQESVLTSAYYAGYFDWPRANTAEEIADSLGISPATLHQHLRAAERKLLELVCDEQRGEGSVTT